MRIKVTERTVYAGENKADEIIVKYFPIDERSIRTIKRSIDRVLDMYEDKGYLYQRNDNGEIDISDGKVYMYDNIYAHNKGEKPTFIGTAFVTIDYEEN